MKELMNILSTREISILVWSIIIFSILIYIARKEFLNVLKLLLNYKILFPLIFFFLYNFVIVYVLKKISFWDYNLLKDTLIWLFSSGIIVFFNANKISSTNYFTKILKDNLKVIIFLEFLLNFYTFGILTELILVPIISFIVILYEYSKHSMKNNPEHIKVNKFLHFTLSIVGIIFLINIFFRTFNGYDKLFTSDNIKTIYLPIILTTISFPFYYFLALGMIYEEFFVRINFMFSDSRIKKDVKKQILLKANFRINRLTNIKNNFEKNKAYEKNIAEYINSIK
ncbi:hypothetical protein SAMN05421847_1295 [Halpernia humi]|uniref:Uncharacterized protein n=2 Tax=Halpernia humi TaxID=493375 RepID=A0A1H5WQR4_9FLAO|nr:hypothetical protein SAMN05421847_1295 [Halpernia humi]